MHQKHLLDPNWKFDISITSFLVGSGGLIRPDAIYDNPGTGIAGVWELKPANPSSSAPLAPLEAKEYAEALNKAANTIRFMTGTSGGAPLPFEGEITVMDEYTGYVFRYTIPNPKDGGIYWTDITPPKQPSPVPVLSPFRIPDFKVDLTPKQVQQIGVAATVTAIGVAIVKFGNTLLNGARALSMPIIINKGVFDIMPETSMEKLSEPI